MDGIVKPITNCKLRVILFDNHCYFPLCQAKLTTTSPVVENGRVKARRQLSVDKNSEPMEIKKAKTGIESDSDE